MKVAATAGAVHLPAQTAQSWEEAGFFWLERDSPVGRWPGGWTKDTKITVVSKENLWILRK